MTIYSTAISKKWYWALICIVRWSLTNLLSTFYYVPLPTPPPKLGILFVDPKDVSVYLARASVHETIQTVAESEASGNPWVGGSGQWRNRTHVNLKNGLVLYASSDGGDSVNPLANAIINHYHGPDHSISSIRGMAYIFQQGVDGYERISRENMIEIASIKMDAK